jgi:predicted N-acetyltransferase YhbS
MNFDSIKNNIEKESIKVESATEGDIEEILKIQAERLLNEQSNKEELPDSGFLVNSISEEDIIEAIHHPESSFIFVAKDKSNVTVGYVLAYDFLHFLEKHPEWKETADKLSVDIDKEKVVYGKHIAVKKNSSGVGTALNNKLFDTSKDKGYSLFIGEICEGPIKNNRSAHFHSEHFGLNKVGEYQDKNQYEWGIYAKEL